MSSDRNLLRARAEHEHSRVTFVELFFDVVFVFAVTQLSHSLCDIDAEHRSSCEPAYIRDKRST